MEIVDMYVCMYVCMYACMYECIGVGGHNIEQMFKIFNIHVNICNIASQ